MAESNSDLVFPRNARHPVVDEILRDAGRHPANVKTAIHSADEILHHALDIYEGDWDQALAHYFSTGLKILAAYRRVAEWRFGGFGGVGELLDFASGFGRVVRFLVGEMPAARVHVSDLYADAVAFQEAELGVRGFVSTKDPEKLPATGSFDMILVNSLFSHLPQTTFLPWLRRLVELLAPEGLLALTVHDASLVLGLVGPSGFHFQPSSESWRLDASEYGTTYVSEGYMREAIAKAGTDLSWKRLPRAIVNFQDLYVIASGGTGDFSTLVFASGPKGFFEDCAIGPDGIFRASGWAVASRADVPVEAIEVRLGGQLLARTEQFSKRPDVASHLGSRNFLRSGWGVEVRFPAHTSRAFSVLSVKAVSRAGASSDLFIGSVSAALLRCAEHRIPK